MVLTLDFKVSIAAALLLRSRLERLPESVVTCVPMLLISVASVLMGPEKLPSSSACAAGSSDWNASVCVIAVSAVCIAVSCAPASCALVPIAVRLSVSILVSTAVSGMEVFCSASFSV